jgi:HEAT repeat protein
MLNRRSLIVALTLVVTLIAVGCDPPPKPVKKPPKKKKPPTVVVKVPEKKPLTPTSYSSVSAAIDALEKASTERKNDDIRHAEDWLVMQGNRAIDELGAALNDESAKIERRLPAGRVLSRLGPAAAAKIIEATKSGNNQVKRDSISKLGRIKPSSTEIVSMLIEMMDHQDDNIRVQAMAALKTIGPSAARSADRLEAILNDTEQPRIVRDAAKRTLKVVDKRTKFAN